MLPVKKLLLFCCAIAGMSLLSNCKKNDQQPAQNTNWNINVINATLSSHYNYDGGSYWLYTDSFTGKTDRFYVDTNAEYIYKALAMRTNVVYNTIFISQAEQDTTGNWTVIRGKWVFDLYDSTLGIRYDDAISKKTECSYQPLFIAPFTSSDTNITTVHPTFNLNGTTYNNVAEIHKGSDCFFVNDDAGIIKMRLIHPTDSVTHVWELSSHNITIKQDF